MRNEAGLPSFSEILARPPDDVFFWNKRVVELDHMAGRASHANWVPPGSIYLDRRMREIACKQQQRVLMAAHVSCSTWTCSAYKQDGPMRSSSTGGKSLVAIDHI